MELMPLCIHGDRGPVFVLPHFAQQNFSNPAATLPLFHRVPLPSPPTLAPAPAGSGKEVGKGDGRTFLPEHLVGNHACACGNPLRPVVGEGHALDCKLGLAFLLGISLQVEKRITIGVKRVAVGE